MNHASVFSGIGGPEIAATMLGWDNVFHCEINEFGRAVLDYWYPNSKSYEDITKTDFSEWRGKVNVLTGGFPCQPFSYAGKRKGADDDRYLWPYMFRCIDQIRPDWVVAENVTGITTMVEQGEALEMGCQASIFEEVDGLHRYQLRETFTLQRICDDLESYGYAVQPVLVPACAVGAPHRRDRVFIIGHRIASEVADTFSERLEGQNQSGCSEEGQRLHLRRDGTRRSGQCIRRDATDTAGIGGRKIHEHMESQLADGAEPFGNGRQRNVADTERERLLSSEQIGRSRFGEGLSEGRGCGYVGEGRTGNEQSDGEGICGERWSNFPSVSPVHRGNDGLPFDVDGLAIPFSKWRTESLKAYGNAIVPQVIYEIFRAIDLIETNKRMEAANK